MAWSQGASAALVGTMVDLKAGERGTRTDERQTSRWVYLGLAILVAAIIVALAFL